MNIVWLDAALKSMQLIYASIASENPVAAYRTLWKIKRMADEMLSAFPHIGRPGRVKGTRELVIEGTPYIVPYRVSATRIEVLNVFHGARKWPKGF